MIAGADISMRSNDCGCGAHEAINIGEADRFSFDMKKGLMRRGTDARAQPICSRAGFDIMPYALLNHQQSLLKRGAGTC